MSVAGGESPAQRLILAGSDAWQRGEALAAALELPLVPAAAAPRYPGAVFIEVRPQGLALKREGERGAVWLECGEIRRRLRQGRRLALARAVGTRPGLRVLDGMAGFGLDGMTLAALGCDVLMSERDAVMAALLGDALERCRTLIASPGRAVCRHERLSSVLAGGERFDVVYLDPVFPRRAKTALPNRRAQMLEALLGTAQRDEPGGAWLAAARSRARERVVVKRRRNDGVLASVDSDGSTVAGPHWQIRGRSVRFDVYRGGA